MSIENLAAGQKYLDHRRLVWQLLIMKLHDYLKRERLTQTEFASRAGVSITVISRTISGDRLPGRAVAMRIVAASGGAVGFDDIWPSEAKAGDAA